MDILSLIMSAKKAVSGVTSVNGKNGDVTLTPSDIGIGQVFNFKGTKSSASSLPTSGNEIGDVWYVEDEKIGYIWTEVSGAAAWQELGDVIDVSQFASAEEFEEHVNDTNIHITSDERTQWNASQPSDYIATATFSNNTWTINATFEDIKGAYNDGKNVHIALPRFECECIVNTVTDEYVVAGCVTHDGTDIVIFTFYLDSDSNIYVTHKVTNQAASTAISDSGNYYDSSNVEGALTEIGAKISEYHIEEFTYTMNDDTVVTKRMVVA